MACVDEYMYYEDTHYLGVLFRGCGIGGISVHFVFSNSSNSNIRDIL